MMNPRRNSYPYANNANTHLNSENPFPCQTQPVSFSSFSFNFLKKAHVFPFLLSIFLFLTWLTLRIQHSSQISAGPRDPQQRWSRENDLKANLMRYLPSQLAKNDKRGWLLNPISVARDAGISGGAVSCVSVHAGEIRPGGVRGNHRHYTTNETFLIWGARTKFRLENRQVVDKGYAEVMVEAHEVAVASSPSGIAHALVNVDPLKTIFFLGCQDSIINHNNSTTIYNVWKDI